MEKIIGKIFAIDFDGTICESNYPGVGVPKWPIINFIKQIQKDNYIILYTMREGELLQNAIDYCSDFGIRLDAINDNIEFQKQLYGNNPRKIYADYYLDDHNITLDEIMGGK